MDSQQCDKLTTCPSCFHFISTLFGPRARRSSLKSSGPAPATATAAREILKRLQVASGARPPAPPLTRERQPSEPVKLIPYDKENLFPFVSPVFASGRPQGAQVGRLIYANDPPAAATKLAPLASELMPDESSSRCRGTTKQVGNSRPGQIWRQNTFIEREISRVVARVRAEGSRFVALLVLLFIVHNSSHLSSLSLAPLSCLPLARSRVANSPDDTQQTQTCDERQLREMN